MASVKAQFLLHRSALKAPGSSKHLSPQVRSTGVHFNEAVKVSEYDNPSYPTPEEPRSILRKSKTRSSDRKANKNTSQIHIHGPLCRSKGLEPSSIQLASQLHFTRAAEEDRVQRRDEPLGLDRAPPKRDTRDEFPEFKKVLMGPWVKGPDYSPVMGPELARALGTITIHQALAGPYETTQFLDWEVTQPFVSSHFCSGSHKIMLETFQHQPATYPQLSRLHVISPVFQWSSMVLPIEPHGGVTIHDILHMLGIAFRQRILPSEMDDMAPEVRALVLRTMEERVNRGVGPPYACSSDRLLGKTKFAGLAYVSDPSTQSTDTSDYDILLQIFTGS
ncbi:hypothetical protein CYLTODRAFT_426655 [Cylindrobasidium torrendii FP15055 ss-10]|uniref:DUF6699 domain-containing protein n=1 Tax=Cylindrobasidium torrendii FP15055 ss-10 TaxID=1314674 RepID=A0A0D7AXU1_9AGAR|nr:hypothetical protein CYLTODRAFT_426655 [Cylindrobasidium torrendii FP15055 ss-10]